MHGHCSKQCVHVSVRSDTSYKSWIISFVRPFPLNSKNQNVSSVSLFHVENEEYHNFWIDLVGTGLQLKIYRRTMSLKILDMPRLLVAFREIINLLSFDSNMLSYLLHDYYD